MPEERAAGGGAVSADAVDGERSSEVAMFFLLPFSVGGRERKQGAREQQPARSSSRKRERERDRRECGGLQSLFCRDRMGKEASERESESERVKEEEREAKQKGKKSKRRQKKTFLLSPSSITTIFFQLSPPLSSTFSLAAGTQKAAGVSNRPALLSMDSAGDQRGRKWRLSGVGAGGRLKTLALH